jgi:iron complex outermembrane recepter protein
LHTGIRFSAWTVNLFVNNLTDERGVISARANSYLQTNDLYYIQPRTVGLLVTWQF